MSFIPKTFDQIYAELTASTQDKLPGQVDFEVGSVVRTLYESFSYELALLYEQMDQVYQSAFIDTASGVQLEMVAAILGIRRGLPDFAEGEVVFERDLGSEDLTIPIGTLVTTEDSDDSPRKPYTTLSEKNFPATETHITVKVQAVNRGEAQTVAPETITVMPLPVTGVKSVVNLAPTQFLGKRRETDAELRQRAKSSLLASGKASLTSIETALLSLPGVREVKVVESFEVGAYGVLDVYVDGTGIALPDRQRELKQRIDDVRAAGVYVRLKQPEFVQLDGLFQLEIDESAADQAAIVAAVKDAIADYLSEVGIGQPLLFPLLTRQILAVPGVVNVEEFVLRPQPQPANRPDQAQPFYSRDKRIDMASAASKFRQRRLSIVAAVQKLPVSVSFKIERTSDEVTVPSPEAIAESLDSTFAALEPGEALRFKTVVTALQASLANVTVSHLVLTPKTPSLFVRLTQEALIPSFAEQLQLQAKPIADDVSEQRPAIFAYQTTLDLVGAIRFMLDDRATQRQRTAAIAKIAHRVNRYLDQLDPEQAVNLDELSSAAASDGADTIDIAPLNADDFRAWMNDRPVDRVDTAARRITVAPLEKARAAYFLITDQVEPLTLRVEALTVTVTFLPTAAADPKAIDSEDSVRLLSALKDQLRSAISTFPVQTAGAAFTLEALQQPLLTLGDRPSQLSSVAYEISELIIEATSTDHRVQTSNLVSNAAIHVRSHEQIRYFTPPDDIIVQTNLTAAP